MSLFDYYRDAMALMSTDSAAPAGLPAALGGTDTSAGGVDSEGNITIPNYSFVRERVPGTYDEERRPGSRGQRYFSDYAYSPSGSADGVRGVAQQQASALQRANAANMTGRPGPVTPPDPTSLGMGTYGANSNPASSVINSNPVPPQGGFSDFTPQYRYGGIAALANGGAASSYNRRYNNQNRNGYYLGGPTDGMGDSVPATIDGTQEARLSDGEFVLPADVVSHLGNGNSNAGAQNLYSMMDRVRKARTGNTQQGKEINPNKFIPSR